MNRIFKRSLAGVVAVVAALLVGAPQVAAVPDRVDSTVRTTQAAMTNKLVTSTAATVQLDSYGIAATQLLRNGNSGKCLTVRGNNYDAPAVQYSCIPLRDQEWRIQPAVGMSGFKISNANSGQCLVGRGHANYTPVVQTACAPFADQLWYPHEVSFGSSMFRLKNVNSGKCVLVQGHGQDAPAVQFTCANYPDQYWF